MKPDGIITQKTKISISTPVETSNLIHITVYIKSNIEFYQKIMQELWLKSKLQIDFFQFNCITLYILKN
jgi:hypothetical protein